jgi:hypothetical protein
MKYSANLPKLSYKTDVGIFSITNFFGYYKFSFDNVKSKQIETDNKSTLVETAGNAYNDPNSFWLILLANQTINPFTLFSNNSTIFIENNQNKNTSIFNNQTSSIPYNISAGSLLVPFANTGGNPYDYSYVGNFDINGDIFIVEDQNFYNKRIVVKPNQNGVASTFTSPNGSTAYKYIDPNISLAESSVSSNSVATSIEMYLDTTFQIATATELVEIVYDPDLNSGNPTEQQSSVTNTENTTKTIGDTIKYSNKYINIFDSSTISYVTGNLVLIKYS